MSSIRIRTPFAASFTVLLLASAYLGLSTQKIPQYGQSDKGLHFVTFFLLTTTFYWILETSRRRIINFTLLVCTASLAIGSEVLQAFLPNDRSFDPYDILANVVGSALALAISSWYHKRMLERRRKTKHYDIVPREEDDLGEDAERDVELGEGVGSVGQQETGVVHAEEQAGAEAAAAATTDVTDELDHWDENEEDWEEDGKIGEDQKTPASSVEGAGESKKRVD